MTLGTRPNQVASNMGPAAYPPTPNAATGWCLRNTRRASSIAGASMAKFLSSVAPPLPFKPATRNVSSGSPACGTSFISIPRSVPTSRTSLSLPLESHSCAIASAGKTCPPVPPPAIRSFTWLAHCSYFRCPLRNSQQPPESVRRAQRGAHSSPAIDDKERNHHHRPDKTQFLADHRKNKIRVCLRQIEELLFALHQAYAR